MADELGALSDTNPFRDADSGLGGSSAKADSRHGRGGVAAVGMKQARQQPERRGMPPPPPPQEQPGVEDKARRRRSSGLALGTIIDITQRAGPPRTAAAAAVATGDQPSPPLPHRSLAPHPVAGTQPVPVARQDHHATGAGAGDGGRRHAAPEVERQLELQLIEWNGLPDKPELEAVCIAVIDGQEVARTAVCKKSAKPYWNETFKLVANAEFFDVTLRVAQLVRGRELVVGNVSFKQHDLKCISKEDQRFPLEPPHVPASGLLQVSLRLQQQAGRSVLAAKVFRGRNFLPAHLHVTVKLDEKDHQSSSARSKASAKTSEPVWEETFVFSVCTLADATQPELVWADFTPAQLRVAVWEETVCVGEVVIPVSARHVVNTKPSAPAGSEGAGDWYALNVPRTMHEEQSDIQLGSLRAKLVYQELAVLPSECYEPLSSTLLSSLHATHTPASAAYQLGRFCKNKEKVAMRLTTFFASHDKAFELLARFSTYEIEQCPKSSTLFRGNTFCTKVIDQYMKRFGNGYLIGVLAPVLEEILASSPSVEIDPLRVPEDENLASNLSNLQYCVNRVLIAIVSSAVDCPAELRRLFHHLSTEASRCFPDEANVRYTAVTGFLFLRFFALAISNPKLFNMSINLTGIGFGNGAAPAPISSPEQKARALTLISKTIQNLGNLGSELSTKEPYMTPINRQVVAKNADQVKRYIELVSVESKVPNSSQSLGGAVFRRPSILRTGFLNKRGQGRKKKMGPLSVTGRRNFKPRYFVLDTNGLVYYKDQASKAIFRVPATDILAVQKVEEDAFGKPFMFQVIQPERPLYLVAHNESDMNAWIRALRSVGSQSGSALRVEYHPGAFVDGRWTCCKRDSEKDPGCKPCETSAALSRFPLLDEKEQSTQVTCEVLYRYYHEALEPLMMAADEQNGSTAPLQPEVLEERAATIKSIQEACADLREQHGLRYRPPSRAGSFQRPHASSDFS